MAKKRGWLGFVVQNGYSLLYFNLFKEVNLKYLDNTFMILNNHNYYMIISPFNFILKFYQIEV